MSTAVVRVPERVHQEAQAAARVTGRTTGELFEAAWKIFKESPDFEMEIREAQKALASGDIETVTDMLTEHAARAKAQSIRESRRQPS